MYIRIVSIIVISIICYTTIGISQEIPSDDLNTVENTTHNKTEEHLLVTLNSDLLSVSAKNVTLEMVMREIVRISGINGWMIGGDMERVTIDFKDTPLRDGIDRILKDRDYGFSYNQDTDQSGTLNIVGQEQESPIDLVEDSDIVSNVEGNHVGPYRKIDRIIRVSGSGLPERNHSKDRVLDYVMSNVEGIEKKKVLDFMLNVDSVWFTNTLARLISTYIPNVSPEDIVDMLEVLKTSDNPEDDVLDEVIIMLETLAESDGTGGVIPEETT